MADRSKQHFYTQPHRSEPYYSGTAAPQRRERPIPGQPRRLTSEVRKNRQRMTQINLPYLLFLCLSAAVLLTVCANILKTRAYITEQRLEIREKQTELQKLKGDNDALENSLQESLDLEEIYRIATEDYHMTYPSSDQVIYYDSTDSGYVRQYEEIPTD